MIDKTYKDWLNEVKQHIREARIKVALAANSELVFFYFELGKKLLAKSNESQWGNNWLGQLSIDLRKDFPDMEGFSKTNLYNIRRFYQFYEGTEFFHQVGGKIPWRHHVEIFTKAKEHQEAKFYIEKTIENGWSRDILSLQIKSDLYARQGKAINNFKNTLSPKNLTAVCQL